MANYHDLRAGLKNNVQTATGIPCYDYLPDNVKTPCAIVVPGDPAADYQEAMGQGVGRYYFDILVLVGKIDDKASQTGVDAYLASEGEKSILRAVPYDRTLGGAAYDVVVRNANGYGEYTFGSVAYLGVKFGTEVLA